MDKQNTHLHRCLMLADQYLALRLQLPGLGLVCCTCRRSMGPVEVLTEQLQRRRVLRVQLGHAVCSGAVPDPQRRRVLSLESPNTFRQRL